MQTFMVTLTAYYSIEPLYNPYYYIYYITLALKIFVRIPGVAFMPVAAWKSRRQARADRRTAAADAETSSAGGSGTGGPEDNQGVQYSRAIGWRAQAQVLRVLWESHVGVEESDRLGDLGAAAGRCVPLVILLGLRFVYGICRKQPDKHRFRCFLLHVFQIKNA